MSLKCFVIDDEDHALEVIVGYVNATPSLELVGVEKDPVKALAKLDDSPVKPDIVFLDIEMPDLSGINIANYLKGQTMVIFTTAFEQFAVQAFEKDAIDYLLKPISYERFLEAVNKARKNNTIKKTDQQYFYFHMENKGKVIKVFVNDIVYIEARQNYILVVLQDRQYLTYLSMTEVEDQLNGSKLVRCHKSFILNLDKIDMVDGNCVTFSGGKQVTLGPAYKENVMKHVEANLLRGKRP